MNSDEKVPILSKDHQQQYQNYSDYYSYDEIRNYRVARATTIRLIITGFALITFVSFVFVFYLIVARNLFCQEDKCSFNDHNAVLRATGENTNGTNGGPRIKIKNGEIQGIKMTSRDSRSYNAFLGIPYAKPPIGSLRFQLPEKMDDWQGILNTTVVRPQCIQRNKKSPEHEAFGLEDCLYLNLYSPYMPNEIQNSEKLPVMIYFHGGGWDNGNGSRYGAEYFMDEDTILITFDWRLGAFGFLNSGEDGIFKANIGFKDQVLLLKWVQENIESFGGDPEKVLIFGNSAGSFTVHYHVLSPMSKGLFKRAICQSGISICPGFGIVVSEPDKTIDNLGQALNCTSTNTTQEVFDCLMNLNASEIAFINDLENIAYGPSIETPLNPGDEVFATAKPLNVHINGESNDIDWMVGINNGEGVTFSYGLLQSNLTAVDENWDVIAPLLLGFNETASDPDKIAQDIKDFYFEGKAISNETQDNLTDIFADRQMMHCSKVAGVFQSKISNVYLYYLTKRPEKSYVDDYGMNITAQVAAHADELQYLFPYKGFPEIPVESPYYEFSKMLVKYWVSFANTGIPTKEWDPIKSGSSDEGHHWFQLDSVPKMITPFSSRINFWDGIPLEEIFLVD